MEGAPSTFFTVPAGKSGPRGKILVFPLLTIGNVPQMAIDLLVNSLRLECVGVVTDETVEPMASRGVYEHVGGLSFACELFQLGAEAVLLQLRSKVRANQLQLFCARLAAAAAAAGWELLVLGSADSGWLARPDEQRLRVYGTTSAHHHHHDHHHHEDEKKEKDEKKKEEEDDARCEASAAALGRLGWGEAELRAAALGERTLAALLRAAAPGCCTELLLFCAEGENAPEALLLARAALAFLVERRLLAPELLASFRPAPPPAWDASLRDPNPDTIRLLFQ
jgi:hypothetical protein